MCEKKRGVVSGKTRRRFRTNAAAFRSVRRGVFQKRRGVCAGGPRRLDGLAIRRSFFLVPAPLAVYMFFVFLYMVSPDGFKLSRKGMKP